MERVDKKNIKNPVIKFGRSVQLIDLDDLPSMEELFIKYIPPCDLSKPEDAALYKNVAKFNTLNIGLNSVSSLSDRYDVSKW